MTDSLCRNRKLAESFIPCAIQNNTKSVKTDVLCAYRTYLEKGWLYCYPLVLSYILCWAFMLLFTVDVVRGVWNSLILLIIY